MKIVLEHLTKRFPNRNKKIKEDVIAANDLTFEIPDGKLIGLLGPSGCGKSTTLNLISGLETPTEGHIYFGDNDVTELPAENRGVGLVFQNYALYPHLTVEQNIVFPLGNLRGKDKLTKEQMHEKAVEVAKLVQIDTLLERKPSELSGGQQQRVAIARALVVESDIVVMDEPITNLDAKLREEMLLEIRLIQKRLGATILYITHDQQSALQLCDKMAIMEQNGSLCQYGSDEDIILHPANRFTFEFIGVSNFIPLLKENGQVYLDCGEKIPYSDPVPEDIKSGVTELGVRLNDVVFDNSSPVKAVVTSRIFLGSEYNYFLKLGQREIRVQQSMLDARTNGVVSEGESTGIRFLNARFYDAKSASSATAGKEA